MGQRKWQKTQIALLGRIFLPNRTYALARVRVSPIIPKAKMNTKMEKESEKLIEAKLREATKKRGGIAIKLLSQFHRGLPDRILLLPGGKAIFVETKSTGKKPGALQRKAHQTLRALGFDVYIIDSTKAVEDLMQLLDLERAGL